MRLRRSTVTRSAVVVCKCRAIPCHATPRRSRYRSQRPQLESWGKAEAIHHTMRDRRFAGQCPALHALHFVLDNDARRAAGPGLWKPSGTCSRRVPECTGHERFLPATSGQPLFGDVADLRWSGPVFSGALGKIRTCATGSGDRPALRSRTPEAT
jgi:hypothetical protein